MLERETRREKTLEQRSKDVKSKQGAKVPGSAFHSAVAIAQQSSSGLAALVQPPSSQSPTSPSKKMFESLKETLQALQNQENATNNEANKVAAIEPPADMMHATDNQGTQINLSVSQAAPTEPSVDQHLQVAEESFFETIDQVFIILMI